MAIAVIEATAIFFVETKRIILVGAWYFLLTLGWTVFWTACMVSMSGIGEYEWTGKGTTTHQGRQFYKRPKGEEDNATSYMMGFMFFSYAWINLYIKECNIFALMASVSTFYYDSGPNG